MMVPGPSAGSGASRGRVLVQVVQNGVTIMPRTRKAKAKPSAIRKSISLPYRMAGEVDRMAKSKRISSNRVLIGLIEKGLEARERERERFHLLAQKLIESKTETERKALKEELAKLTFG